jgi:preprotein translocase subunit Sec63
MNSTQLNNALLEILLHIGNSFDIKKVANEALISYLQQLNLAGIILYEKQRVEYTIHTVKPKNIKSNRVIIELFDDMILNIKDIQKEYFDKDMPYIKIKNQNFYYIYELKGFGLLMFIKNSDALENDIHKALRQLNLKFATSLVACNNLNELRKQEEQLIQ